MSNLTKKMSYSRVCALRKGGREINEEINEKIERWRDDCG